MEAQNTKNQFARHISHFLAELLRTRKIEMERAADVAQKVVENINLIDNESHFLSFVKELTKDFEELFPFRDRVHMDLHVSRRRELEQKVRSYAVYVMTFNISEALGILQDGMKDQITLEELYAKYPKFKEFTESYSDSEKLT